MEKIKIIFLDIDGVLNNTKTQEHCGYETGVEHQSLLLLKDIVDKTTAKICLVSSWKEFWFKDNKANQDEMANYLDEKLAEVGLSIWDKTKEIQKRGKEIKNYISDLKVNSIAVDSFVILDDELLDYEEEGLIKNLVPTNYLIGLTAQESIDAINILS